MRLCASNLALPAFDHRDYLDRLRPLGIEGLEIAPAHTWSEPAHRVPAAEVEAYRRAAEAAGLAIVGLHALLDGRLGLGLLADDATEARTLDYLVALSALCRDVGGKTLIFGARWRDGLAERDSWLRARAFMERLVERIEPHGTVLCLAPLAEGQGDLCASAKECYLLVNAVDHPSFGLHLGAAGLARHGEMGHATFAAVRGRLEHFHTDEPDFAIAGSSGRIDHADLRRHLAAISYFGWISLIQRHPRGADRAATIDRLGQGARAIIQCYLPIDTR